MEDEECTTTQEKKCTNLNEQKGVLQRENIFNNIFEIEKVWLINYGCGLA